MQLYVNPPRHLPGRASFKGKLLMGKRCFTGLMACVLVMMITWLPGQAVSAETQSSATQQSASKKTASSKPNSKSSNKKSSNKKLASKKTSVSKHHRHHPRDNTYMKRKWGVEVMFLRTTSAGYMLEFRYKVLDANKAKPLFERQIKPHLVHLKSGAKLIVPTPAKTGALRNSNPPKDGKVYWMFFANPRKLVKVGDAVNIDIGDFHVNGLVVEK